MADDDIEGPARSAPIPRSFRPFDTILPVAVTDQQRTAQAAPPAVAPSKRPSRPGLAVVLFVLCVVAIPGSLIALSVHHQKMISQNDETQHIDYLDRIEHFGLPRFGDRVG